VLLPFGVPLGDARPVDVGVLAWSWGLVPGGVDCRGAPFTWTGGRD
jgi:hypothetical protein